MADEPGAGVPLMQWPWVGAAEVVLLGMQPPLMCCWGQGRMGLACASGEVVVGVQPPLV